jgi:hypothetical protein
MTKPNSKRKPKADAAEQAETATLTVVDGTTGEVLAEAQVDDLVDAAQAVKDAVDRKPLDGGAPGHVKPWSPEHIAKVTATNRAILQCRSRLEAAKEDVKAEKRALAELHARLEWLTEEDAKIPRNDDGREDPEQAEFSDLDKPKPDEDESERSGDEAMLQLVGAAPFESDDDDLDEEEDEEDDEPAPPPTKRKRSRAKA